MRHFIFIQHNLNYCSYMNLYMCIWKHFRAPEPPDCSSCHVPHNCSLQLFPWLGWRNEFCPVLTWAAAAGLSGTISFVRSSILSFCGGPSIHRCSVYCEGQSIAGVAIVNCRPSLWCPLFDSALHDQRPPPQVLTTHHLFSSSLYFASKDVNVSSVGFQEVDISFCNWTCKRFFLFFGFAKVDYSFSEFIIVRVFAFRFKHSYSS